jgi:hypothetical protein
MKSYSMPHTGPGQMGLRLKAVEPSSKSAGLLTLRISRLKTADRGLRPNSSLITAVPAPSNNPD